MEMTIKLVTALAELAGSLKSEAKRSFVTSLMTIIMALFLYTGWNVMKNDGDIMRGLSDAFVNSLEDRLLKEERARNVLLQYELRQLAASDTLINRLMSRVLERTNGARIRLAIIHNGITNLAGGSLMRFDITHAQVRPGRAAGEMVTNASLSEWADYSLELIQGRCVYQMVPELKVAAAAARLNQMNVRSFYACPVIDVLGQVLAATFVSWDQGDTTPSPAELEELRPFLQSINLQVAAALDLRVAPAKK